MSASCFKFFFGLKLDEYNSLRTMPWLLFYTVPIGLIAFVIWLFVAIIAMIPDNWQ